MQKRYYFAACGMGIGALLMGYFLLSLDWQTFLSLWGHMHATPLALAALLLVSSTTFKALRLGLLLSPHCAHFSPLQIFYQCNHAIYVGSFGNFVFPARAGEFLRVYQVHKNLRISLSDALTMCMVDRMFDVWSLFILGGVLITSLFSHMPTLYTAFLSLLGVSCLGVLGLGTAFFWPKHVYRLIRALLRPLPQALQSQVAHFVKKSLLSLQKVGSLRVTLLALTYSIGYFALSTLMCYELFAVFNWELPFTAAITIKLCLSLAGALPSAPAFIGLYQAAAIFALAPYFPQQLGQEQGMAFALTLQILSFILYGLLGGGGFVRLRQHAQPKEGALI